jgi:hypothetical protein
VATALAVDFPSDASVKADTQVQQWSAEMRNPRGGNMATFPVFNTVSQLVDAVTACIHIAAPQRKSFLLMLN